MMLLLEAPMFQTLAGNPRMKRLIQGGFFLTALVLLVYGLVRGEADVVLKKAIRVCLECIGIG